MQRPNSICILRNPSNRKGSHDVKRKKESSVDKQIFYREVRNGKVSYEFNATYRKPADDEWVAEIERPKSTFERKRSQPLQDTGPILEKERLSMYDVTTAKFMSKEIQK